MELIGRVLEQVEDEFSGEPNHPERWMELDRMFPPQPDNSERPAGRPGVTHWWSKGHHIYVGVNGSMEFWTRPSRINPAPSTLVFSKVGTDGKGLPS
jgi:hypothetical protein